MASFPSLRPSALRKNVATVLRDALFDGRFQPGEELSDSALAAEFQVSRGPVREALLILAEEGLVEHRHHRGFFVPRLEWNDLQQISRARKPLEVLALELARPRAVAENLRDLKARKKDLLAAFRRGGMAACARTDYAFHSLVWQMSGDPWLQSALRRIAIPYFAYVSAFNLARPDHSEASMDAIHQRYIDFLAGDSAETAEECVSIHLSLPRAGEA